MLNRRPLLSGSQPCVFVILVVLGVSWAQAGVCNPGGPLPSGWSDLDIGNTGAVGCASYDGTTGTFTVQGAGSGTFITSSDSIHFAYRSFTGNFEFIARMNSISGPASSFGGLMVRLGTGTGSRNIETNQASINNGATLGSRQRVYDGNLSYGGFNISVPGFPQFHRVTRYNDQLVIYGSQDGSNWNLVEGFTLNRLTGAVLVGFFLTSQTPGQLATAEFSQVGVNSLVLPYATSWFGNSLPGGGAAIQQDFTAIYVDPGNQVDPVSGQNLVGKVYTNSFWDEGLSEAGIYDSNGNFERRLDDTHGWARFGGFAVTAGSTFVYQGMVQGYLDPVGDCDVSSCTTNCQNPPCPPCAPPLGGYPACGTNWYSVRRYNPIGTPAPFAAPNGANGYDGSMKVVSTVDHVRGLAINNGNNELYVSDAGAGKVQVYNGSTMAFLRNFNATRPRGMALDSAGNLWVIQADDPATPPPVNEAKITKFKVSNGNVLKTITGVAKPTAVTVASDGKIWVTDDGPDQQVKIFNANGNPSGTFGDLGGIYSGTKGQVQPKKFNDPVGLGFDNSGNLYAATDPNGATTLRKFDSTASRNLLWEKHALEFVDAADADPSTDGADVFSPRHHYLMNYAQPTGQQWTYSGFTVDRFAYPDDMRLHTDVVPGAGGVLVRRIGGQRFMFLVNQQSNHLGIYRFTAGSEIAIPCSMMAKINLQRSWPPHEPASNRWIWHDLNGNGKMEGLEGSMGNEYEDDGVNQDIWGWYVDDNGDVWTAAENDIPSGAPTVRRYLYQGLDSFGCPQYHSTNVESFMKPSAFTTVTRALYVPSSDTMYIAGYTPQNPASPPIFFGNVGREIRRYNNWHSCASAGQNSCVSAWQITDLPWAEPFIVAKGIDIAGDRIVVGISSTAEMRIYDTVSGAFITNRKPGPEVAGKSGWLDTTIPLNASKRANGEILIFVEEDAQAKQMLYRVPPPNCGPCQVSYCTGVEMGCVFSNTCGLGGCCSYQCGVFLPECVNPECPPNVCGGC